jgi:hypothetical protein
MIKGIGIMNNSSKQSRDLETLYDPWEIPVSKLNNNRIDNSMRLMVEVDHLLPVIEEQKLLTGTNPKLNSTQIIIKDWVKLKTQVTQKITEQIKEAIALLLLLSKETNCSKVFN